MAARKTAAKKPKSAKKVDQSDLKARNAKMDALTVEMIIANLTQNARTAQQVIASAVATLASSPRTCACGQALATAIITRPDAVPDATRHRLAPIMGKYLGT